jgi:dihydroneopterin aldolase
MVNIGNALEFGRGGFYANRRPATNRRIFMDIIFLRELKIETLIGVYEWEKRVPQTLQIDLDIALPDSRACETDDIADALNYADIVRRIQSELAARHFNLLEALAERIAQILLEEFKAPWAKVSVAKLQAIRGSRMVGISIERGQLK